MKISTPLTRWLRAAIAILVVAGFGGCGGKGVTSVSLGGTISGFTTGSLTLSNGVSTVTLAANAASFTFPAQVAVNGAYAVQVAIQPVGMTCSVTNNTGVVGTSDISSVSVTCVPNHSVGGTITGVTADGLQLANGSDVVIVPATNRTTFTFAILLGKGQTYGVTVLTSPVGQRCTVLNGINVMDTFDVTNVAVSCL